MQDLLSILKNPRYTLIAMGSGGAVFAALVWLPNYQLIGQVVTDTGIPFLQKLAILTSLLTSISTNFSVISAATLIAIAMIGGVNGALVVFLMRTRRVPLRAAGGSMFGAFLGMFGVGCAACGMLAASWVFSLVGISASVLGVLPFGGAEFGIVGVGAMAFSTHALIRGLSQPAVCTSSL